jgi:hypothetical protein
LFTTHQFTSSGYVRCPELQNNVPAEQLYAPAQTVDYLLNVLDNLEPAQSGEFSGV